MRRFSGVYFVVFALIAVVAAVATQGQVPKREVAETEAETPIEDATPIQESVYRAYQNVERGDFKAAIQNFGDAIEQNPDDANLYLERAYARAQIEDYTGALADFDQVVSLRPVSMWGYMGRAVMKINLGREEEAAADCRKALGLAMEGRFTKQVAEIENMCGDALNIESN